MMEENSRVARHAKISLSRCMDSSPKSKTDVALQSAWAEVVMNRKIRRWGESDVYIIIYRALLSPAHQKQLRLSATSQVQGWKWKRLFHKK